eukprot:COSAG02_NODE_55199_length_292_cov_0.336788_1_plen_31_part_01
MAFVNGSNVVLPTKKLEAPCTRIELPSHALF